MSLCVQDISVLLRQTPSQGSLQLALDTNPANNEITIRFRWSHEAAAPDGHN